MSTLDACLQRLRYVKDANIVGKIPDAEIRASDLNDTKECLKLLSQELRNRLGNDPLVDELDAIISRIPYVYTFDYVLPEHHNLVVDALKKARDIIAKMAPQPIYQPGIIVDVTDSISDSVGSE